MSDTLMLMSRDNPHGWKLEDLLDQLVMELNAKTDRLLGDTSRLTMRVVCNNREIMTHLRKCALIQRDTIYALDAAAPNQGPLGKPRIGR